MKKILKVTINHKINKKEVEADLKKRKIKIKRIKKIHH